MQSRQSLQEQTTHIRWSGGRAGTSPGYPAADHDRQVTVNDSAEVRLAQLLRVQRQKQLISDSDKLLKLATDLKQQIDNTPAETLSADSVKKAAEIEKLAHSLRQRLKN